MAKENFEPSLAHVLASEGGYVDDPRDPGGATNLGVTRAVLAAYRGRPVTKDEVRALTREEAGLIYHARYWDMARCDALPAGLDLAVFDCAVNSGPARAAALLARALGLETRRVVDEALVAESRRRDVATLVRALQAERLAFLRRLPTWPAFGRGWASRLGRVEQAALALAAAPHPSPNPQEKTMTDTKSILQSRTVWSNAIGFAAVTASILGFDTAGIDTARLTDTILQIVAGTSFVASTVFRVTASKRLG